MTFIPSPLSDWRVNFAFAFIMNVAGSIRIPRELKAIVEKEAKVVPVARVPSGREVDVSSGDHMPDS